MATAKQAGRRQLGANGPFVYPIALGCMGMSGMYGAADETESIATIHAALERGVNLLDTGDFYGMGHNEMLVGRAIKDRRDQALLSVKFGAIRAPNGAWIGYDARPAAVKNFLAYSLKRLGVDHIDIYRPARLDPAVPIEDTIGAIAELVEAGFVRYIGLSEMGPETIRRAHAVHPICDLQIEYAVITRGVETNIFPALEELGIGVTAYGVLSRGLLSGSQPSAAGDFRAFLPRFRGENLSKNQRVVEKLAALAREKGITPVQLAIAWVLAQRSYVVPLIGARRRMQLEDALRALNIQLSPEDLRRIDQEIPAGVIAGARYGEDQMKVLDSEK